MAMFKGEMGLLGKMYVTIDEMLDVLETNDDGLLWNAKEDRPWTREELHALAHRITGTVNTIIVKGSI